MKKTENIKVAFQGRHGAYSESVAFRCHSVLDTESQDGMPNQVRHDGMETLPFDSFEEVHKAVKNGVADFGVIPIENSTAGSVLENYDLLLKYRLPVVGEAKLQINHSLIALKGEKLEDIKEVISHPQALEQCSFFFERNPQIAKKPFFDTAGSVERIAKKQLKGVAGIASPFAAEFYGLEVLKEPLANFPGTNSTRFFLIQKDEIPVDEKRHTKTSVAFMLNKNLPGALYACLGCFAKNDVDLIRIESRPKSGSPWEYVFYADLAGNPLQKNVELSLKELKTMADVILLGHYEKY